MSITLERGQVGREVVAGLTPGTERVVAQQVDDGRDVVAAGAADGEAATSGLDDVHVRQSVIAGECRERAMRIDQKR